MNLNLNSDQLEAFLQICQQRHFSKAAKSLGLSQPALSQRLRKLEEALETTLIIRKRGHAHPTEAGERLLVFCRAKLQLELDLIQELRPPTRKELAGTIRVAGYSSITRSILIPLLGELVESHPQVRLQIFSKELGELPALLRNHEADFVLTDRPVSYERIVSKKVGEERQVLAESKKRATRNKDLYFDHDPEDTTTFDFFKFQGNQKPTRIERAYLDEIYSIMDVVERGWGRAVLSWHLIEKNPLIEISRGYRPMVSDIYLNYVEQPFYSLLHRKVIELLSDTGQWVERSKRT